MHVLVERTDSHGRPGRFSQAPGLLRQRLPQAPPARVTQVPTPVPQSRVLSEHVTIALPSAGKSALSSSKIPHSDCSQGPESSRTCPPGPHPSSCPYRGPEPRPCPPAGCLVAGGSGRVHPEHQCQVHHRARQREIWGGWREGAQVSPEDGAALGWAWAVALRRWPFPAEGRGPA